MGAGLDFQSTVGWRLALVFGLFVVISIILEKSLHKVHHYFHATKRIGLTLTLKAMEEELMILGFISLSLIGFESQIMKICIPRAGSACMDEINEVAAEILAKEALANYTGRRQLGGGGGDPRMISIVVSQPGEYCGGDPDLGPFIEPRALHDTHIFIFVFAMVHLFYNTINMRLCLSKVDQWHAWHEGGVALLEKTLRDAANKARREAEVTDDADDSVEVRATPSWFHHMTSGLDIFVFLVLRKVFQVQHDMPTDFNFYKYIKWTTGKEFSQAVGVTWWMWTITIFYVYMDTIGQTWIHIFVPAAAFILSIVTGLKFSQIATTIAKTAWKEIDANDDGMLDHAELLQLDYDNSELSDRGLWVSGTDSPRASVDTSDRDDEMTLLHDGLFWFSNPALMLSVVHATMFQNGLTLAYICFYLLVPGTHICYFAHMGVMIYPMLALVVIQLFHSSFITLPLFSIIRQMSDTVDEEIVNAIMAEENHNKTATDTLVSKAMHLIHHPSASDTEESASPSPRPLPLSLSKVQTSSKRGRSATMGAAPPPAQFKMNLVMPGAPSGQHDHDEKHNPLHGAHVHHSKAEVHVLKLRIEVARVASTMEQLTDELAKQEALLGPRAVERLNKSKHGHALQKMSPQSMRNFSSLSAVANDSMKEEDMDV